MGLLLIMYPVSMNKTGCLNCQEEKKSYSWSGGEINVPKKIFSGAYLSIIELLENPWAETRYPKEQILQCEKCNAVWHLDYFFPGKPPLHVTAKTIPKSELATFFKEIGSKLSNSYTQQT